MLFPPALLKLLCAVAVILITCSYIVLKLRSVVESLLSVSVPQTFLLDYHASLVEIYAKCFGLNKLLKCLRLTFTRNVVWLFEKSFMVYPEDVEVIAIGWVRIESSRAGTKQPWSPPDINLKNKESDRVSR